VAETPQARDRPAPGITGSGVARVLLWIGGLALGLVLTGAVVIFAIDRLGYRRIDPTTARQDRIGATCSLLRRAQPFDRLVDRAAARGSDTSTRVFVFTMASDGLIDGRANRRAYDTLAVAVREADRTGDPNAGGAAAAAAAARLTSYVKGCPPA